MTVEATFNAVEAGEFKTTTLDSFDINLFATVSTGWNIANSLTPAIADPSIRALGTPDEEETPLVANAPSEEDFLLPIVMVVAVYE